ncbi:MAG: hypothetical protein DMF64_19725 [Acidobacteria bacterium]|nr:MAG: hypothetical protein DMF64_19725 [Acidobacteriota bacterium]
MKPNVKKTTQEVKKQQTIPTVSTTLPDGALVEMVYWPSEAQTAFVLWQHGQWRYEAGISLTSRQRLVPYAPSNNLIKHEVVLLPSEPEEYGSEEQLLGEIQTFLHHYVDVSPLFEKIATYYVLFSWVYDGFNELPYLRLRGDPGSGKTRFLLTVGALCYKPIFASGASTVSPLFRIIDSFRGTLIIDEGDFRLSDERAEIVKILNNGNARGFPVLRSEATSQREFDPRAYAVFGPKLVATRGFFQDRALESRCLTEEMGQHRLRNDVPINMPSTYKDEALHIRNKLLLFRFRNLHKRGAAEDLVDRSIEPRLNQIFVPLLSIIDDAQARDDLRELARQYNRELIAERGMDMEAQILEIIRDLFASGEVKPSIKDITSWFTDKYGADYERKITAKWIGGVIRKRLNLKTQKSHGVFVVPLSEKSKLERLYEKYGISPDDTDKPDSAELAS